MQALTGLRGDKKKKEKVGYSEWEEGATVSGQKATHITDIVLLKKSKTKHFCVHGKEMIYREQRVEKMVLQ